MWAENLSASYKSSYIYNQEMWLEEPREERERSVCEPESMQDAKKEDDGEYYEESWQRFKGEALV